MGLQLCNRKLRYARRYGPAATATVFGDFGQSSIQPERPKPFREVPSRRRAHLWIVVSRRPSSGTIHTQSLVNIRRQTVLPQLFHCFTGKI
jgi:hypothetical protein